MFFFGGGKDGTPFSEQQAGRSSLNRRLLVPQGAKRGKVVKFAGHQAGEIRQPRLTFHKSPVARMPLCPGRQQPFAIQ
jgi:hypothetical protein